LPGYQSIGITAPILFILLRMIQGVSIGGEYSGVMIYLAELAPANKRGFFTSFAALGANLGFLSATLVLMLLNTFLSAHVISAWAWRLPFILAGIAGTLLLYLRFKLPETPTFAYLRTTHLLEKRPLITALKKHPGPLIKIIGLSCMSSTLYYLFFGFIPNQLKQQLNNVSTDKLPLIMQSVSLTAMLFLVPLAGLCGDYFGRRRMLMLTTFSTLVLAIPAFQLLYSSSLLGIWLAFFLAFCLSSFDQGNTLCAVVENCPANVRYSGVSFSYNLGNAIFGGTAPLVATLLSEKFGYLGPAYYLMITSCVSLFAASTLLAKEEPLYDAG
jgi:MFS transporter, MHS family, proline/betaine transporter